MPTGRWDATIWFRHFTMAPVLSGMLFVFQDMLKQKLTKGMSTLYDVGVSFSTAIFSTFLGGWLFGIVLFGISTTASAFMQAGLHRTKLSRFRKVVLIGATAALAQILQGLTIAPAKNLADAITAIACVMLGAMSVYLCAPDD